MRHETYASCARRALHAMVLATTLALAACGGGSGGGSSSPPSGGGGNPQSSSNWDSLKWDQDNWA
jgi:hypothetical protein